MIMPKVYVTQETNHDFSQAEKFGTIEFLTASDLHNIRGSLHNERVLDEIRAKLNKFDPREDYIVIAGSPYVSAAVFIVLGLMGFRSVKMLRWSNRDRIYVMMYFDVR
jgi:hypothetical protein